jgi:hypothetical protein
VAKRQPNICQWVTLDQALKEFVLAESGTQGTAHIRKMHWYVACSLVVEGGFHPDSIKPRPPFVVKQKGKARILYHDPSQGGAGEATVFGGLKTKDVDVVVALNGIGPCVAVSMKGALNAFRNLTNRLEEAVGDCTNIHIAYPALVYGFVSLLRANPEGPIAENSKRILKPDERTNETKTADVAVRKTGDVTTFISNYHNAMARLTSRRDLRDDVSRYEAISVTLVSPEAATLGQPLTIYPPADSPLQFSRFFEAIYQQYDLRFVYGAPDLRAITRRLIWDPASPALADARAARLTPRVGEEEEAAEAEAELAAAPPPEPEQQI